MNNKDFTEDFSASNVYETLTGLLSGDIGAGVKLMEIGINSIKSIPDYLFYRNLTAVLSELKSKGTANRKVGKKLAESANRVLRLSKDKTAQGVDEKLFVLDEEKALFSAIKNNCMEFKNLEQYMKCLENLVEPINNFFDKVLVMDKDEKIKNNRLALLNLLKEKFSKVCDFQYL